MDEMNEKNPADEGEGELEVKSATERPRWQPTRHEEGHQRRARTRRSALTATPKGAAALRRLVVSVPMCQELPPDTSRPM